MPNGDLVAFPDDMPKAQIRALIEKKFPNAARQAQADTGAKPYQGPVEGLASIVQNLPASISETKANLGQMAAEAITDVIAPQKQYGNIPPPQVTPGAPIEGLLNQPAGFTVPQPGVEQLIPEDIRRGIGEAAAKESVAQQLRGMAARAEQAKRPFDMEPGIASDVVQGLGSAVEMVAPALASVAIRNPGPLVAYFTARSAGQGYGEARKAGAGTDAARAAAGLYAASEAVTEAIAGKVFVEGGKTLVRSILKSGFVEGLTEGATEAFQVLVDAQVIGKDMTLDEAMSRIKTATVGGTVAGSAIAPVMHGVRALGGKEATPGIEVVIDPKEPPEPLAAEDSLELPAPETLLALPSPEAFAPAPIVRRQPAAPVSEGISAMDPRTETDYQARVALQKTKQQETAALLQTARETVTPLGTFTKEEIGGPAAQRVATLRIQTGRPVDAPVSIAELARAKVPQSQIDALIAQRRPLTTGEALTPLDIMRAADAKNIIPNDANFRELAYRTTGQRNVERMTQAQLNALQSVIAAMPSHSAPVTVPVADESPFTDEQYGKAVDALRNAGRYTEQAIKDATGLKTTKDVHAVRDALVRRGQLVQRSPKDFRLYDVVGEERQAVPDDLPPGAFKEHVVRRLPVKQLRVTQNGKSVGTFGSATQARSRISQIRAAEAEKGVRTPSALSIEPAADVAYGVMENRYDEQGNLLGQVVVDTHRDEAAARDTAEKLNNPDVGARYTQTAVEGQPVEPRPAPKRRAPEPAALAGRVDEIVKRLNKHAKERKLPLLGARVTLKSSVKTPDGRSIEGLYEPSQKLISLTVEHLDASMSTDEITEKLAQVMDHELIHALRLSGVLSPESDGWRSIMRYARRAKRPGTNQTYLEWANQAYGNEPGYERADVREEEAIAEAFRHWAKDKRSVVGQPATVFRQIVEWFRRLLNSIPEDLFQDIATGRLVEEALRPPGSGMPRARTAEAMAAAGVGVAEAKAAQDENLIRVRSREFLRARAQAREDRYGRSGPKTVLGTTPSKAYTVGEIADRDAVAAIADKYRAEHGLTESRLMTMLPEDVEYMKRVADAQQAAAHSPKANDVAKAYRALIDETRAMWQALGPVQVESWMSNGQPYATPAEMFADVQAGTLKMRLSNEMFGEGADNPGHPLYTPSGVKATDGTSISNNDLLRAVHDIYGYGQSGFRSTQIVQRTDGSFVAGNPQGEYNAYHEHSRLLSPEARRALATETLAQSAWANYGPHLRRSDGTVPRETDVDYLEPRLKEFAEQKAFVLSDELVAADPGWALAQKADEATEDTAPRYSRFDDNLPGGRLYGNPKRSPGGALSAPGTPSPAFTNERPGNAFFGGELAEEQLRMVRQGDRGATMIYMSPEDYLALASEPVNPEQEVYDAAVEAGYKFSGMLSLVIDGYAGNVRATGDDGAYSARALAGRATEIPVVLYPKKRENLGLVTAIEGADGSRVPWPHEGRQENFPDLRGARYSVGSPEFKKWFGDSKVVGPDGAPLVVYHGSNADFNAFSKENVPARWGDKMQINGFFFSADPQYGYVDRSASVYPVFLHIENPYFIDRSEKMEGLNAWNDAAEFVADLREKGHDGIIWGDPTNLRKPPYGAWGDDRSQIFVFEPTQIKSAIANKGTWNAANPDIRYSLNAPFGSRVPQNEQYDLYSGKVGPKVEEDGGDAIPPEPRRNDFNIIDQRVETYVGKALMAIARSKKDVPLIGGLMEKLPLINASNIFDWRVKYQDAFLSIKEMLEYARDHGGKVLDENNFYVLQQAAGPRAVHAIAEREKELYEPLFAAMDRSTKKRGNAPAMSVQEIEDGLYARHAPERNQYLNSIGAEMRDENGQLIPPSGMSDNEANVILDKIALDGNGPIFDEIAALFDRINGEGLGTTGTRKEGGLIPEDTQSPFKYYARLRNALDAFDPDDPVGNIAQVRSGKGFSANWKEKAPTGRKSRAGDLIAHAILQNTEAVIRAEKARAGRAFLRFVLDNQELMKGTVEIVTNAPKIRTRGADGRIKEITDPNYKRDPLVFIAKVSGKDVVLKFAPNAVRLARAMNSDYVTQLHPFLQMLGAFTRYQAVLNTAASPVFMFTNPVRDLQQAGILLAQYDVPKFTRNVFSGILDAAAGVAEVLYKGTATGEYAQAFQTMQKQGWTTEFLGIHDLQSAWNRVQKNVGATGLKMTARQAGNKIRDIVGLMGKAGQVTENMIRVSAYVQARRAGATEIQAGYLARNITTNFNKGGENKALMSVLYVFHGAATQGVATIFNGLKNKRVQKLVGALIGAGFLMDIINRALSGDDNDNGVKDYDEIPDYVLRKNWVFMNPMALLEPDKKHTKYLKFPMPYGLNAFTNYGRNLSNMFSGSPVHNPVNSLADMFFGTLDAFNTIGGGGSLLNFVAPTLADPVVDLTTNTDFAGNDIVPDRPSFGPEIPESQKYWNNTDEPYKDLASFLNSIGGGNEFRKGVGGTDWSPEQYQYVVQYLTGGLGTFLTQTANVAFDITPRWVQGDFEDVDTDKVPFLNRFVGTLGNRGNTELYYENTKRMALLAKEIKEWTASGNIKAVIQTRQRHPAETTLLPAFEDSWERVQDLGRQLRELHNNEALAADVKRAREKFLRAQQDAAMASFNKMYFQRKKLLD
jgi:hypothetical protein